jgi:hypothetical protein
MSEDNQAPSPEVLNARYMLSRRVSINREHGELRVRIARRNDSGQFVFGLFVSTAIFVGFCYFIVKTFLRNHYSTDPVVVLLFTGMLLVGFVGYSACAAWCFWEAFGKEEILLERGVLRLTRTALWWVRTSRIAAGDISEIAAITPWHGRNCLEFTAKGRRHKVGEMILRDEAMQVAHELRRALGLL